MSTGSIWGVHLDALQQQQTYRGRVQVQDLDRSKYNSTGDDGEVKIVQQIRVVDPAGWDLLIHLPNGFPEDAPRITFSGYRVPMRWTVNSLLPEAVDQAVNALNKLSGSVGVISVNDIANTVAQMPNCEAAKEANSLRALVESSPQITRCQQELEALWGEIERTANGNIAMQPTIQQLQQEVATLQHQVKTSLAGLGGRRRDVLEVLPLGSTEGLIRVAKEELRELEEAAALVCKALGSNNMKYRLGSNIINNNNRSTSPGTIGAGANQGITSININNSVATVDLNFGDNSAGAGGNGGAEEGSITPPEAPPANVFFVPTTSAAPAATTSPAAASVNPTTTAATSVFSAPLSLDSRGRGASQFYPSGGRDIADDEDDDEGDETERAVEYALKVCIEARRAALLLRRFSAGGDNK